MNKLYVALNLIRLLNENRTVTSALVAEDMGISLRTAQRYLLEMSSLPGVCYDDSRHCWYMAEKYGLSESYLKQDELAVLSGLFDYAENILNNEFSGTLRRIKKKVISASNRERVVRFLKQDSIEFEKIADIFAELETFIMNRQEISFLYSKNGKSYIIKPYRIIYGDGFWYLAGDKNGEIRKFSLDLIENLKATGSIFDGVPEGLDAEIDEAKSMFFDAGKKIKVECILAHPMADFLRRKRFFPHQQILEEYENLSVRFSFQAGSPLECVKLCLEWLPHIRILSPHIVRDYFADILRESLEVNGG
ncbi:helix-turn-helix transcriptional regulator [Seleniivibrio woodruffii]|uniref:Putative DNA-binding transcriptional regulator YafY n=1 Tax=Seleniivibrio woodruffii TaxID=1078050 RepID=A0A4R1K6X4_9BACT|nr:WYL domain-containing protein [Seleniivibrio woodruffii]TCK59982.1 putative DNA-binding transcriptional regulator YafY [Seleniivibrio woodruffii]TVZ35797.1 putative DNA-binding transcriptional regulator YafY [Seleniivibrio woodruffii]